MVRNPAAGAVARVVKRRPRGSLNQQVIVDAALALTDREGLSALTFDKLGRELGALTDELHAQAQAGGLPVTDDWAADLRMIAARIRGSFMAHPQVGQLLAARTARRRHEFDTVEYVLGCLRRAGLDDVQAARCYRVFADFVLAYSSMEAALEALDPVLRAADLRAWEVDYRLLDPGEYPNVAAAIEHVPALDDPSNFELAVELMIESLRARAGAAAPAGAGARAANPLLR